MWLNDLYPSTLMRISERQVSTAKSDWFICLLPNFADKEASWSLYAPSTTHPSCIPGLSPRHSLWSIPRISFLSLAVEVPRIPWCPCVTWDEYRWRTNQLVVVPSIQVSCHHPSAVNGSTLQVICLPVTPLYPNILDGRNRMWYLFFENTVTVLYRQWDVYLPVTLTIRQN